MSIERDALASAMAALVEDEAMAVPFHATYGDRLANVVRQHLRELGRWDLVRDVDEVQGLVWDVVLLLHDIGGGWKATGALPWTWAHRAIRAHLASAIGHALADVDPDGIEHDRADRADRVTMSPTGAIPDFDDLAEVDERLGLYRDALGALPVSTLHRAIHREYRIQKGLGDPSPSKTVAAEHGVTEANVRQIDLRVRRRLAALVSSDARFAALRAIPWLDWPSTDAGTPTAGAGASGERAA